MAKHTAGYVKSLEQWTVTEQGVSKTVLKIAVRDVRGKFHGATNFRASGKTTTAR